MQNCLEELVYYNVFADEFISKPVKFIQCITFELNQY